MNEDERMGGNTRTATCMVVEGGWVVELSHEGMPVIDRYACQCWAVAEHVLREWLVYGKRTVLAEEIPRHPERGPVDEPRGTGGGEDVK